jgi:hypothetical protein
VAVINCPQYYTRNVHNIGGFPVTEINGEKTVSFTAIMGENREYVQKNRVQK